MRSDARARVRGVEEDAHAESSTWHSEGKRDVSADLPIAADLFVPSLPGLPNLATHPTHPLNVYAGSLPSYPGEGNGGGEGPTGLDAKIFFMMVKARRSAGKQRVILWFNGGPGCSSFDGSLMEVGPFRTVPASQTESGKVELRLVEGGWEEFATIIFIDQPPGTGFSYVPTNGYLHELDQGSQHLIQFLQNFYHVFPELNGVDTYLAGESFAGQYIPYFGDALLKTTKLPGFSLAGLAIGNGWIDPKEQYPGYADFAYDKGLIQKGTAQADNMEKYLAECRTEMEKYPGTDNTPINIGGGCQAVMDAVSSPFTQELNGKKMCMNVYDVRLMDDWPACGMNWPPDLTEVYDFLRRPDVITALHATDKETAWVECSSKVSSELRMHQSTAAVAFLPSLLERGVPIMMFVGAEDLICNYAGIERMMAGMEWSGAKGLGVSAVSHPVISTADSRDVIKNATVNEWYLNNTQVGEWTESRNLTYAKVFGSSHMVAFDVPHVANDMMTRFMGVEFALLPGLLASSGSKVGDNERMAIGTGSSASAGVPLFKGGGTDWEAWYNAGSALLILLILLSIVGLYFYFRRRGQLRRRVGLPSRSSQDAERVPLGSERVEMDDIERAEGYELDDDGYKRRRKGKGKERARGDGDGEEYHDRSSRDGARQTVFSLGDEDEDQK